MDAIEILVMICSFAAVIGLGLTAGYYECHSKAEKQGYVCEWGPLSGCMVKTEHGWMDYDRLRYMKE
ncbi:hypothetical protein [Ruminobacter amylophilus]|uniref:hypothetical protein n=1 Tax=Ruminobacter amylophilus TaxID=867 RepID=UPI003870C2B8